MEIIRDLTHFQAEKNMALSIGNFDGVHIGHAKIVERVVKLASDRGFDSGLITFDPHPMKFFGADIKLLQTTEMKIREFERLGVDKLFLLPFDMQIARINPELFVTELLLKKMKANFIVVGHDYRFGRNRAGSYEFLQVMSAKHGFTALRVPKVEVNGITASSTNIRKYLSEGRPEIASSLLGRNFVMGGIVERGDGLATKIGFPTANIAVENELIPAYGVYSCRVHIDDEAHDGALYIGERPTIDNAKNKRVEAHVFDYSGNLYGKYIEVEVIDSVRGDQKFESVDELVRQIDIDCKKIRVLLGEKR
jgi:riboflavin kinase/FMN adenylyltransferase